LLLSGGSAGLATVAFVGYSDIVPSERHAWLE